MANIAGGTVGRAADGTHVLQLILHSVACGRRERAGSALAAGSHTIVTVEARAVTPEVSGVDRALEWIDVLAAQVGPRRPTSPAERIAAELVRERLRGDGVQARLEPFDDYSTFGAPIGIIATLAVAPGLVGAGRRRLRAALALSAATALALDGGLVHTPVSNALSRRRSQNVVAEIEPRGEVRRTLCLLSHVDTSRSGLIFHPRSVAWLNAWIAAQAVTCLGLGAEALLCRHWAGRRAAGIARGFVASGLALLAERELRGEDVPGANDNASGVAVCATLAAELAAQPPAGTRIVLLVTGCEEAGLLGAQSFLRAHDTTGWLFLNFDSVGGAATLRYPLREGLVRRWKADDRLVALAEGIATERPELGLEAAEGPIGLTYDTTVVLARGGRGITFVAGNGVIPNYHWPTDTVENVDHGAVAKALELGREMVGAIDRGEAD